MVTSKSNSSDTVVYHTACVIVSYKAYCLKSPDSKWKKTRVLERKLLTKRCSCLRLRKTDRRIQRKFIVFSQIDQL